MELLFQKKPYKGFPGLCWRESYTVKSDILKVADTLFIPENHIKWYDYLKRIDILERLGPKTNIIQTVQKMGPLFKDRDFLIISTWRTLNNGIEVYLICSINDHPKAEKISGCVRGEIYISGTVLRPSKTIEGATDITALAHINLGGSIPKKFYWSEHVLNVLIKKDLKVKKILETN